jgi:HAMP domain-containing protein
MPRYFAIDWDRNEVRGLLLSAGATGTSVVGAWAASLATAEPAGLSGKQIGSRLAAAIAGSVSGKVTTLVGVGRDNVQIKLLSLPPAPADELPDLVRFQAEREFTALGTDATLDFIPITGDERTPHQVLALALNAAGMLEAREVCETFEFEADRIPVRGCAAAALATRAGEIEQSQVALVVNPLADEADLVVQADEKVILLRTVRLPDSSQGDGRQRALTGEIRRTIAAVRQQLTDRHVSKVIICGNDRSIGAGGDLADELGVVVAVVDPSAQAPAGLRSQGLSPESVGRFGAVLGMALSEAARERPIVDFANIRKRVESRRFTRVHALAAAAAAMVVLAFAFYLWQKLAGPTRELADLRNRIGEVETQAATFKDITAQAAATNRWASSDVNWLDELEQIARRVRPQPLSAKEYPVQSDVVMTQLIISRPGGNEAAAGKLTFNGVAKNSAAVKDLEDRLRDEGRRVTPGTGKVDKSVPGYDWSFGLEVSILPPGNEASGAVKR